MDERATLTVRGAEAEAFLENLVTCGVASLEVGELSFGALLTPQGKILFDFHLLREDHDAFLLDTPADVRDELVKRLLFYRLRTAVEIAADTRRAVLHDGGQPDARSHDLPPRRYATGEERLPESYHADRIRAGVPEAGRDFAYGEVFPHDVALDAFADGSEAGVSFGKGCYVGQEVVSRMKHRGTVRRRPVVLELDGQQPTGAALLADGREVGALGTVVGNAALAIARVDRLESAGDISVNGTPVRWSLSPLLLPRT